MLSRLGAPQLLAASSLLTSFGLVMVYSASAIHAELAHGSSSVYLLRQVQGVLAGVAVAALLARIPLPAVGRMAPALWIACIGAIAATLTPLGAAHKGASRWLELGGIAFQPLEFAKLAVVLVLARWLAMNESRLGDWRASLLGPLAIAGIPGLLLLLQPDFGGALMLAAFAAAMVFAAGAPARLLALAAAAAAPVVALVAVQRSYRLVRLESFVDPWLDPQGRGYQLVQSLLAFGAGGWSGTGLGSGQQKLGYLPEAHTDFILSVVGEETGLVGVALVLVCFGLLGASALAIASRGRDTFSRLVAFGAGLLLWMQGLVNGAVAMGLLPTKGTTLPLFSYGRSSLIASLAALGLILNVARPARAGRPGWR
jgi:cell division protein FtsW